MSRILAALVAATLIVVGLAFPASAVDVPPRSRTCVSMRQVDAFPEHLKQWQTERWLGHPQSRPNPDGADRRAYSVQYKLCGHAWNKGGFFVRYKRADHRSVFGLSIIVYAGTI